MTQNCRDSIPIVDLFAGPGGLGEGFSSLAHDPFRILVSAEMDVHAHATLRLRAFYRILRRAGGNCLQTYFDFCNSDTALVHELGTHTAWAEASSEAQRLTLGNADDNARLDGILRGHGLGEERPWVLIGGPPCQAYSLVGRSRNRGKADYSPESDHRHFLYREYLRIIQKYRPAVFVMENVKGILSSKVGEEHIFHSILEDLADPDRAVGLGRSRQGYRIHSLSNDVKFERGEDARKLDARKFIVRAEDYGIPQARHRVILLGVREDIPEKLVGTLVGSSSQYCVRDVLAGLPQLRSRLSKQEDSPDGWAGTVHAHLHELAKAAQSQGDAQLASLLRQTKAEVRSALPVGALRFPRVEHVPSGPKALNDWFDDSNLTVWLNHETRGHMSLDLMRYVYAATFAQLHKRSPKGHDEFNLIEKLRPFHANWESGKFSDRFRVQCFDDPATTITSHISKDGHYFIHPDPTLCRSLTVREAARIQTFPDNYFFQGNRTQQYHQVGNAVPPLLANQIARVVHAILK